MQHRFLGKTGLKVSELCLGTMTFGREADEALSHQMLHRFIEAGGNFIDTANVYANGASEVILGRWLKEQARELFVIATKVRFPMSDDPNAVGLSRKHIMDSVDASLRRLQTDHIDLYQVHCWDAWTPLEETLSTLNDLVRAGKVRYIGASNFSGWQLQRAIDLSQQHGWERFVCLQPQYNLLARGIEWEVVPVCLREGVGIIPWSPLRGGWLSGKFRRGMEAPPEDSRIALAEEKGWGEAWSAYNNEHTWSIVDVLLAVAEEVDKPPAQVAIQWLLERPGVTSPIIGARTLEQLENNLGSIGWQLDTEQMARLNQISDPGMPYPYDHIARAQSRR